MAKRQLKWTFEKGGMVAQSVEDTELTLTFEFKDILDYEEVTNPIVYHTMRHGIKQILADTIAGMKDDTIEDKFKAMDVKWEAIRNGTFTTRKPKAPKIKLTDANNAIEELEVSDEMKAKLAALMAGLVK